VFTTPPASGETHVIDTDGVTSVHSFGTHTVADTCTLRGDVGGPNRRVAKYTPKPTAVAITRSIATTRATAFRDGFGRDGFGRIGIEALVIPAPSP
jgi:hypothetical protein